MKMNLKTIQEMFRSLLGELSHEEIIFNSELINQAKVIEGIIVKRKVMEETHENTKTRAY